MMYVNAQQLYQRLIDGGIINAEGYVSLTLLGLTQRIEGKSAVGDLIQEWLGGWMTEQGIDYRTKDNTQEFPDFLLDEESDEKNLLEVKTFDYEASPNFDVANFEAYVDSLQTKAYRLDADYLILGYTLVEGVLTIKNIRLKKIWEICCSSENFPLRVQKKRGMIYNIRPSTWYSTATKNPPFQTKDQFLDAVQGALNLYPKTKNTHKNWIKQVKANYKTYHPSLSV